MAVASSGPSICDIELEPIGGLDECHDSEEDL